jgi:hypothetical protein
VAFDQFGGLSTADISSGRSLIRSADVVSRPIRDLTGGSLRSNEGSAKRGKVAHWNGKQASGLTI